MLDRLCEGLLQTEGLDEGLQAEQTAVLESVEMFENRQYLSEVDEVRADETAEIMAEVFTPEVVPAGPSCRWNKRPPSSTSIM